MNDEVFDKTIDYAKAIIMNYSMVMDVTPSDDYNYYGKRFQQGLWVEMLQIAALVYTGPSKEEVIKRLNDNITQLEQNYAPERYIAGRIQANLRVIEILNSIKDEEKEQKVPRKYRKIVRF